VVHAAAGVGLALRSRLPDRRGLVLGVLGAAALAIALRGVPFEHTTPLRLAGLALPAALLAVCARAGRGPALRFLAAGLLILGSIKLGQAHAEWFLARGRDEIAPRVTDALARHRAREGAYPAQLGELVPRDLPEIPQPRIGWLDWDEEVFTYTDLGESFLLEFPGPVWVQCAYSPPYEEDVEEGVGVETAGARAPERLEAAWSCERKPPRLW
jgi:hypothetical protein